MQFSQDYDDLEATYRGATSQAEQTRRTSTYTSNKSYLVNLATAEEVHQNSLRPGAETPPLTYTETLQQHSNAYDLNLTATKNAWTIGTTNANEAYHVSLATAQKNEAVRWAAADDQYAQAEAQANLAYEQARIAAEKVRREAVALAEADYAHASAQVQANFRSGQLAANVAGYEELADQLQTHYADHLLDKAEAEAAAWETIKADFIAQNDPAGTNNLATAAAAQSTAVIAAWETMALAQAAVTYQQTLATAAAQQTLDQSLATAELASTTLLARGQKMYEVDRSGAGSFSSEDYTAAGLTVESWTDPETGETWTNTPDRNTVYQATVKTAWRTRDAQQSTARLDYIDALGTAHINSESTLAAATRTYQLALTAARQAEQQARDQVWADFAILQAEAYADEIASWQTSPATPWHEFAATQAAAQVERTTDEQAARLTLQGEIRLAESAYVLERENAYVTLRNSRATQTASDAYSQQQIQEEQYLGYEYYGEWQDQYTSLTIDLPTPLGYSTADDPTFADTSRNDNPFDGSVNLQGVFGSQIGSGDMSEEATSPWEMASQADNHERGSQFDLTNPFGSVGNSTARTEMKMPRQYYWQPVYNPLIVNWQGDLTNQPTNQSAPSQLNAPNFRENPPQWTPPTTPSRNPEAMEGANTPTGPAGEHAPELPQSPTENEASGDMLSEEAIGLVQFPRGGSGNSLDVYGLSPEEQKAYETLVAYMSDLQRQIEQLSRDIARLQKEKGDIVLLSWLRTGWYDEEINRKILERNNLEEKLKSLKQKFEDDGFGDTFALGTGLDFLGEDRRPRAGGIGADAAIDAYDMSRMTRHGEGLVPDDIYFNAIDAYGGVKGLYVIGRAGAELSAIALKGIVNEAKKLHGSASRGMESISNLLNTIKNKYGTRKSPFGPNTIGAAQVPDPVVLQTGGHTITNATRKALELTKDQAKRAMEGLKKDIGQGNANHNHKILDNGDVLDADSGELLGNLYEYLY